MQKSTDVAIVGGGVIGCTIAYYLAKQGIKSTVFEQTRFGHGASSATAGMIGPTWHISEWDKSTMAVGMKSLEMFPTLAAELREAGVDPQFQQTGILKIALTDDQVATLKRDLIWQAETGLGTTWLSADEVLEREPEINPGVLGGVYSPREGSVRGQSLVDSLVNGASRLGAAFLEGVEIVGLETSGQRVTGVKTVNDTFPAGHTVLAAGPWTGIAGRWVPQNLPIRPVKGQHIRLRKAGFLPKSVVRTFNGPLVPHEDGSVLLSGTRQEGEFDQELTAEAIAQFLACAVETFPILKTARFVEGRAGVRPGSPDDKPILGPIAEWDGLSISSGHFMVGVMLAPGTGQLMADYIATGDAGPLEPFRLDRFSS